MYLKTNEDGQLITIVYVDDLIFDYDNEELSHMFADDMERNLKCQ